MTILCEVDPATVDGIAPDLGGAVRVVASLPEAAVRLADDDAENLVVIGRDTPLEQVLDFAQHMRKQRPAISVVLLRSNYDPKAIMAALDAGVQEVVPANDPAMVLDACRRAVFVPVPMQKSLMDDLLPDSDMDTAEPPRPVEPPRPLGKVITVFSPKGGSGKTTISTNLAVALSQLAPPVCLIDLDLEFGDVAISLRMAPTRTLADAVKMEVEGDEDDALALLTTDYSEGLKCILAPIEPADANLISSDLVTDLLSLLRARYAFVVIDTPSQLSPNVLASLDASDHHVLVANPEVPALKNLRLTLDMFEVLHYPRERRSIIFNRSDPGVGLTAAEVEEALKARITAEVPASRDVPASINRGEPIVAARKDHPVSVAITKFAASVLVGESNHSRKDAGRRLFRRRTK
jgi:pilus assembly protein CpaE